jgi:hypothetical protein
MNRLAAAAKSVPQPMRPPLRWIWSTWQRRKLMRSVVPGTSEPHGLPGELIVSLTSFPPRFSTLHLTLRSLLLQASRPDRLILWIAHDDLPLLPAIVRELQGDRLEVRGCEDLRSYKKLVPAVAQFPDAFIATADDDLYYPPDWLQILVEGADRSPHVIVARRTARVRRASSGRLAPFHKWESDVQDEASRRPSGDLLPETGGGALYPPNSLHKMVTERTLFERLAPTGDDLWFYWCARMAGTLVKKVGDSLVVTGWSGSPATGLWNANARGGNDGMIRALEAEFGSAMLG